MAERGAANWMLSEAMSLLAQAETLHRRFFGLAGMRGSQPCWEPPMDIVETEAELIAFVALPGVDPEQVEVFSENGELVLRGRRSLPEEMRRAAIHRLELPQGRFERRVPIPPGRYEIRRQASQGYLLVRLAKTKPGEAR